MDKNYFIIPNSIFNRGLSAKAIAVYCCLARHAGTKGQCFPSRRTVARECSLGISSVDRAVAELLQSKLIKKEQRKNSVGGKTSNLYYILHDGSE